MKNIKIVLGHHEKYQNCPRTLSKISKLEVIKNIKIKVCYQQYKIATCSVL